MAKRAGALPRIPWGALRNEVRDRGRRSLRWLRARRAYDPRAPRTPVFIVGCQRSGTNMLAWTLERAPEVWLFHEHKLSAAFRDYRLRATPVIERLIRRSPAPCVVFKPICDAHLTDRLLARHAGARAIWIYRHYADVANSMARNWPGHSRDILRWIAAGDTDWLGWRGERLAPDSIEFVRACFRSGMLDEEAAAVFWWLRNRFFFELDLGRDPRVLLVRYEDLVAGGDAAFRRVFDFAGVPYSPQYLDEVFDSSVGKRPFPTIDTSARERCEQLFLRLEEAHAKRER